MDRPEPVAAPRAPFFAIALAALALAVYGSLVPLRFAALPAAEAAARFDGILHPSFGSASRIDLAVNFALFLPVAFFGLGFLTRGRPGLRPALPALALLLPLCLATSVAIESAQVYLPSRVPSGLDVLAQLAGTLTGALLWLRLGPGVAAWVRAGSRALRPRRRLEWVLQGWAAGLLLWSLLPLDLTLRPSALHDKWQAGRIRLVPFAHGFDSPWRAAWELGLDVALFVPIGMLARLSRAAGGSAARATALGFLYVLAIELAQLLVFSRVTDVTDLVTGLLGVGAGVLVVARSAPADVAARARSRSTPALLFAGWSLLLVALFWAPFDFRFDGAFVRPRLDGFLEVPLRAAFATEPLHAAASLLRKLLLFAPLGLLAAWAVAPFARAPRRAALAFLLLVAAGLATGIELGQVALPGRTGKLGDVLVSTLGALGGALAFPRRRATP